jgi:hypothetical protein
MAKDPKVKTVGVMMLISGIINVLVAIVWAISILAGSAAAGVATCGLGCVTGLLAPVAFIIPFAVGIFEIIVAAKLLKAEPKESKLYNVAAIAEICSILWLNLISMGLGIANMVLMGREEFRAFFRRDELPPQA